MIAILSVLAHANSPSVSLDVDNDAVDKRVSDAVRAQMTNALQAEDPGHKLRMSANIGGSKAMVTLLLEVQAAGRDVVYATLNRTVPSPFDLLDVVSEQAPVLVRQAAKALATDEATARAGMEAKEAAERAAREETARLARETAARAAEAKAAKATQEAAARAAQLAAERAVRDEAARIAREAAAKEAADRAPRAADGRAVSASAARAAKESQEAKDRAAAKTAPERTPADDAPPAEQPIPDAGAVLPSALFWGGSVIAAACGAIAAGTGIGAGATYSLTQDRAANGEDKLAAANSFPWLLGGSVAAGSIAVLGAVTIGLSFGVEQ